MNFPSTDSKTIPEESLPGAAAEPTTWSARNLQTSSGFSWMLFRIFRFFSSVQLAIPVILGLMIIFSVGTFVESFHGAEAAAVMVYRSPWFPLVLFLLGLNVTASAIDRLPWKKKHIGFVMTHVGIIMILIGSFITKEFMVDGQMAIQEGDSENRISLSEPMLYVFSPDEGKEWQMPLRQKALPWEGYEPAKLVGSALPFTLAVTRYFPKAEVHEKIEPSKIGERALELTLLSSVMQQSQWLIKDHPQLGQIQMGPAKFSFTNTFLKEPSGEEPALGYLEFQFPSTSVSVPLERDLASPETLTLDGTPYRINLIKNFRDAAIVGNDIVEEPLKEGEAPENKIGNNPAVVFYLEGEGFSEKHTVFANFPDFPTVHGMKPSQTGAKVFYRLPGGGSRSSTHELRFIESDGKLFYQIQDGWKVTRAPFEQGKEISLGWMDMKFRVDQIYEHAVLQKNYSALPTTTQRPDAYPVIEVEMDRNGNAEKIWLVRGAPSEIQADGRTYHLLYGEKSIPAGFQLKLEDFRVNYYPGTSNPASFESDVLLQDDLRSISKKTTVSMNNPLDYNGFRVFQASYAQPEGEPEISIFSVVTDPGIPVKYTGVIVMIIGTLTMFVTGRFNFRTKSQSFEIQYEKPNQP